MMEYQPIRRSQRETSEYYDLRPENSINENDVSDLTPQQAAALLWRLGDLSWKLWDQTQIIYNAIRALPPEVAIVVVLCARQFSKSVLGVCMAIEDCIWNPNTCTLIVGPTLKQTREIVTPRIRLLQAGMPEGFIRPSKSESKWYIGPKDAESEIVIGGFDVDSSSQRGKTVKNIYIEEIVDSNPDQFNESMRSDLGPAMLHSKDGKFCFLTTPPKIPDHPFNTEWIPKAQMNNAFYEFTIYDNKELTREQFIKAAEMAGCTLDKDGNILVKSIDWLRECECKRVRDPRVTCIPAYNERTALKKIDTLPNQCIVEETIDFGGTQDFTVCLFHTVDYWRDVLLFFDELWWPANTPTSRIVAEILLREELILKVHERRVCKRYSDAPGQTLVDLRSDHNFGVEMPYKESFQANVNGLNVGFAQSKIEVSTRCKLLNLTLINGQLNKQRNDFLRTETLGHCDAIAAAMYARRCANRDDPSRAGVDLSAPTPEVTEQDAAATFGSIITSGAPKLARVDHRGFATFKPRG